MEEKKFASNFIKTIMKEDLESGKHKGIITRFPPEPNGLLHIGHGRAIVINFELAKEFGGKTNLRFDDTNPIKEDLKFVEGIQEDIKWLGYQWNEMRFASDYFDEMYDRAVLLINKGLAYVDDQTADEIRETRGTLTEPGKNSPYRDRSSNENLDLLERMRKGEFEDGSKVLRAKIDMASPNMNMRDPVIYRIAHVTHHITGDKWCIYPMYDYAHPIEDAIEGITHSLCSVEFEDHRPIYDWFVENCDMETIPRQIEFSELNITNTVLSKRYLRPLVEKGFVDGWDDPRFPTFRGLRRRGISPKAIRHFIMETGISRADSLTDYQMLEHFVRDDLKLTVPRTMAVLDPLKVVITNYEEGQVEWLEAHNNPENEEMGTRKIPFSREIYIEREDFMENPPKKFKRLSPGEEVRLRHAYFIKCTNVIKDDNGSIIELHATYDVETKSGSGFTGRKPKGTLHWVDGTHNVPADFRLYEPLFLDGDEYNSKDYSERVNPNSVTTLNGFVEANMAQTKGEDKFQFIRHGYFVADMKLTTVDKKVFNRTVSLKSSFRMPK